MSRTKKQSAFVRRLMILNALNNQSLADRIREGEFMGKKKPKPSSKKPMPMGKKGCDGY
jgi:hypothetical protein